jgi:hypothetical protein
MVRMVRRVRLTTDMDTGIRIGAVGLLDRGLRQASTVACNLAKAGKLASDRRGEMNPVAPTVRVVGVVQVRRVRPAR